MAACMTAKLRVGWTVAGCVPGVRTSRNRARFQSSTTVAPPLATAPDLRCRAWRDADHGWRARRDAAVADGTVTNAAAATAAATASAMLLFISCSLPPRPRRGPPRPDTCREEIGTGVTRHHR